MRTPFTNAGIFQQFKHDFGEMGDFLKYKEALIPELGRFSAGVPLIVRLDGSGFSSYTKPLNRPFDAQFNALMDEVSLELAEYYHADLVYCQSDEITLMFLNNSLADPVGTSSNSKEVTFKQLLPFGGRYGKILSEFAGNCSSRWMLKAQTMLPSVAHIPAFFDARAYAAESHDEALLSVLWRMLDCQRNSVSQLASHYFAHRELDGKNRPTRVAMLASLNKPEADYNNLPSRCRYGRLLVKKTVQEPLSEEDLQQIPEKHREQQRGKFVTRRKFVDVTSELNEFVEDPIKLLNIWYGSDTP